MPQPLVSITIPTFNSAATLARTLESVKSQTYKNIEIIAVDNHSSDDTKEVARKYTDNVFDINDTEPWNQRLSIRSIVLSSRPERSAQRNFGARQAKGDYLLFIDSDMELTPPVVADCITVIASEAEGSLTQTSINQLNRRFHALHSESHPFTSDSISSKLWGTKIHTPNH